WGSCQTKSRPSCSRVCHARVLAIGGTRRAYGMFLQRPLPPHRQSWKGHAISSPLTVPWLRSPPMCRQYASRILISSLLSAHTTSLVPKASIECGLPSLKSFDRPRQCQPRAKRAGADPATISRISDCSEVPRLTVVRPFGRQESFRNSGGGSHRGFRRDTPER